MIDVERQMALALPLHTAASLLLIATGRRLTRHTKD